MTKERTKEGEKNGWEVAVVGASHLTLDSRPSANEGASRRTDLRSRDTTAPVVALEC